MKHFAAKAGMAPYTLKEIFRAAARAGLISDPNVWFNFIAIRNITVQCNDSN